MPHSFLAGISLAATLKLSTSVDDIVWLSPFIALSSTIRQKLLYICIYALVCVYVIFAAQLLAEVTTAVLREFVTEEEENGMISGGAGTQAERYWTTERFLSCVAGIAIGINAAKEWREWRSEPSNAKVCHRLLRATMKAMCRGFKPGRESDTEEAGTYAAGSDEEESVLAEQLQRTGSEGEDKAEANDYAKNAGLASETSRSGSANEMAGEKLAEDSKRSHRRVADIVRDIDAGDSGNSITANSSSSSSSSSNLGDSGSDGSEIIAMSDGNKGPQRLLIVAIFGTLDSMAVFAAIILGGSVSIYSLLIGVLLAAALIVTASWQLASYRPFREAVAALPMWVLLMVISIYIFIHGLFF